MRVLLVEDDRALSLGIQHALEREGWRVDALGDGEQAASEGLLGHHDAVSYTHLDVYKRQYVLRVISVIIPSAPPEPIKS